AAPVFFALAVFGAFVALWRRAWPIALPVVGSLVLYAPFSTDRRFLMPVVPLVLVFAALGVTALASRLAGVAGGPRRALVIVTAVVALGHAAYTLAVTRGIDDAPEHRAAGEWLR